MVILIYCQLQGSVQQPNELVPVPLAKLIKINNMAKELLKINVEDLREYHKNPRTISADRLKHLQDSLISLGDLGGIVYNSRSQEVIGGNQRVKSFLEERDRYTIDLVVNFKEPLRDGTLALGYLIKDLERETEQRFAFRVVDWDEETAERANIQANKVTGGWDYDILANQFDVEKLLEYGFSQQDLDLLPKAPDIQMDNDMLAKSMDSYIGGNIKQIVLFFKNEEFDGICARLDKVMDHFKVESHTEAFLKLIEFFEVNENNHS